MVTVNSLNKYWQKNLKLGLSKLTKISLNFNTTSCYYSLYQFRRSFLLRLTSQHTCELFEVSFQDFKPRFLEMEVRHHCLLSHFTGPPWSNLPSLQAQTMKLLQTVMCSLDFRLQLKTCSYSGRLSHPTDTCTEWRQFSTMKQSLL